MFSPSLVYLFTLTIVGHLIIGNNAESKACDRVLDSMINSCKAIRATLISTDSLDPKVACCKNTRYDLCVKGVKGYTNVAKSVGICQEANYESKIQDLESNVAMQAVKKLCESFDSKTCITDTMSSAWESISETLNPANLSTSISKNFNEALSSISSFTKSLNNQGQNGAASLATSLNGFIHPNQQANQYSIIPETGGDKKAQPIGEESQNSFSFSKILNSFSNPIEIIQKSAGGNKEEKKSSGGGGQQILDSIMTMFRQN
ncbi:hypothetical protein SSS_06096 [Sarcoptes scabiei]|uniref:Uncharacterized protein n=1 Tax=Sarcoptes scabiei TaxID=52283 RepID=A0A834R6J8_SARSC|nr:hypothetical protein SSS_06096 [Sarcoptes scabiei]